LNHSFPAQALERELYEKNAASPKEGRRGSVVDDGFLSKLQGGLGGPPQPKSKAYYRVAASKVYKRTAPKRASLLARDFHLPGFLEGANGVHAVEDAALKASATSSPAKVAPLAEADLEARDRPEAKTRSLQALMEHRYDRKERRNARVEETLERLRRELPAAADARSGPGVLDFHRDDGDEDGYECWESDLSQALVVVRTQGCVGAVACKYATRDGSACAGGDYVAASGELEFADGEVAKRLDVEIVDDAEVEAHSETFFVDLTDATGGATFDATWDGGEDRAVATVVIIDDTDRRGLAGLLIPLINRDKLNLALNDYKSQFRDAVALEGDAPTPGDYAMHALALPWKVCFACIPPPSYGGGWVCFFVALVYIGGLTLVIGELATLLGSALGIADSVTAITFVALGTSLPDTFASKTAATADPYADAAVGNVTGSNSVNVFLGLGPGQHKRAKFPTSKAPISAVFHSFRLIFGRAIISRNGVEAWMLLRHARARNTHVEATLNHPCAAQAGPALGRRGDLLEVRARRAPRRVARALRQARLPRGLRARRAQGRRLGPRRLPRARGLARRLRDDVQRVRVRDARRPRAPAQAPRRGARRAPRGQARDGRALRLPLARLHRRLHEQGLRLDLGTAPRPRRGPPPPRRSVSMPT
jgi:hypothetical protein